MKINQLNQLSATSRKSSVRRAVEISNCPASVDLSAASAALKGVLRPKKRISDNYIHRVVYIYASHFR